MPTLQDFLDHPIESLEKALHLRKQIDMLQKQLADLFGSNPPALAGVQIFEEKRRGRPPGKRAKAATASAPAVEAKKKKGGMSAAGRARIAAAQKARWAKVKAEKSSAAGKPAAAPKKKGSISPEGLARIKAAQKARWAKVKK